MLPRESGYIMKKSTLITILEIIIAIVIVTVALVLIYIFRDDKDEEINPVITSRTTMSEQTSEESTTTSETTTTSTTTSTTTTTTTTSNTTSKKTTKKTTKETTKKTKQKTNSESKASESKSSEKTASESSSSKSSSSSNTSSETSLEVTNSKTTYPDALDSWEWAIVNAINDERKKNGLNKLQVATLYRKVAEEAADMWQHSSNSELETYLSGYNSYASWQNQLDYNTGYNEFIKRTKSNTNLTTRKNTTYIGVGVIYNPKGFSSLPTYYYVVIYK